MPAFLNGSPFDPCGWQIRYIFANSRSPMMQDLKFAVRQLFKNPGFTSVAVLTLALGIGANTAIFTIINALMLRSLPVSHPEQLIQVCSGRGNLNNRHFSHPEYEQFRDGTLMPTFQQGIAGGFTTPPQETAFEVHNLQP